MRSKYLISLLSSSILACFISSAWGQDKTTPEITFFCEDNNGVLTTVAKNKQGETETIFSWKQEVLTGKVLTEMTPKELCNNVSGTLDSLATEGSELSSLGFVGTELHSLPVICLGVDLYRSRCSKVLFVLRPSNLPARFAADILEAIINPKIINNQKIPRSREHLYLGYYVYLVDLFE